MLISRGWQIQILFADVVNNFSMRTCSGGSLVPPYTSKFWYHTQQGTLTEGTIMPPKKLELPKGKIGPQFVKKILPWVEVYWHQHKRYPSDTEFAARFQLTPFEMERIHASKFYLNCLKDRGISHERGYFTPEQIAAISLITNVYDVRPPAAKLAGIGVTPEQYNGWMQNPEFKAELSRRADEILDNIYPDAQVALGKQVKNGNIQALKFYYEITGRAASPDAINLKLTMIKVIEAVQRHVKDPKVLEAIAAEIHGVSPVAEIEQNPQYPQTVSTLYKEHIKNVT